MTAERELSAAERLYDEQIAPELMRLGALCQAHGMSLVAQVEYALGEIGSTVTLAAERSFDILLTHYAARSRGNVDQLAFTLARDCRENNRSHSSIVLKHLGVPMEPAGAESRDSPGTAFTDAPKAE